LAGRRRYSKSCQQLIQHLNQQLIQQLGLPLPIKTISPAEAWEDTGSCADWEAAPWPTSIWPNSSRWGGGWR